MATSKFNLAVEAFKHKGFIKKIPDITRMVKAMMRKEYKPELKNVLIPGAVLLYLISPLDFIPDWIPVVGQMDDLALVALAIPLLMKETENFIAWEQENKKSKVIDAKVVG